VHDFCMPTLQLSQDSVGSSKATFREKESVLKLREAKVGPKADWALCMPLGCWSLFLFVC
jgi:hypothetical protein